MKFLDNENVINDQKDISMAALLHDIGKFWQRSYKKYHRISHEKLSQNFVKTIGLNVQVENMVLSHMGKAGLSLNSKDKFFAEIIKKSDIFSSKEREDRINGTGDTKVDPLVSIFSKLKIDEKNNTDEHFYPVNKLELKNLSFPIKSKKDVAGKLWNNLEYSYKKIWEEFYNDIKKVSIEYLTVDTVCHILRKYTSLIPSAVYKSYPDISLFDHSKTTAAIAQCLYQYVQEKGENFINDKIRYFTLVSGEISGIQEFIYNISSPQILKRGMAKRFRGRSFYTNLLNENLARIIVDRLDLAETNKYIFEKYGDRLFLSLTFQHVSGKDLDNFAILKENMIYNNTKKNKQKYLDRLDLIFKDEESIPMNICKICGSISNEYICEKCDKDEDIGDKITRADFIVRVVIKDSITDSIQNETDIKNETIQNETIKDFDIYEFNTGYLILKKENLLEKIEKIHEKSSKIQVFSLNNTDFLDNDIIGKLEEKNIHVSFGFSFFGNTIPYHDKYGPLDFEHIAKISKGTKKLGMLKMNVDNVEKLFETGLGYTSISRISTLSSLLHIFISGYINEIMKEYYVLHDVCPECREKVEYIELSFSENVIKVYREKEREGKI